MWESPERYAMEMPPNAARPDLDALAKARARQAGGSRLALREALAENVELSDRLLATEARLQRITGAVADYIFSASVEDGRVVRTEHAPGCLAVTGYGPEEFERSPFLWLRMVPEVDQAVVLEQAQAILMRGEAKVIEHRIHHKDGSLRWVRNTPALWLDGSGALRGYDGLVRDITELKAVELERERLIAELQGASATLRKLTGLLPICAGCKSIRNDRGYWEQVEHYIEAHSEAHFSHGLCPECIARLYPGHGAGAHGARAHGTGGAPPEVDSPDPG